MIAKLFSIKFFGHLVSKYVNGFHGIDSTLQNGMVINSTNCMTVVETLNLMSWNCKGVMSAVPYLNDCLQKFDVHICALSEHWLRQCNIHFLQQINTNYIAYSKSVDELSPDAQKWKNYRKGVALLVHQDFDKYVVNEISIDCERIIGVELCLPCSSRLFIFLLHNR